MLPGESRKVINQFGMVSMKSCIEAYLYTIGDDSLNGGYSSPHYGRRRKG